jgi:hypothetical protein
LGNINIVMENASTFIAIELNDTPLSMTGEYGIAGRSLVVHAAADDLGAAAAADGDDGSRVNGNAGVSSVMCVRCVHERRCAHRVRCDRHHFDRLQCHRRDTYSCRECDTKCNDECSYVRPHGQGVKHK